MCSVWLLLLEVSNCTFQDRCCLLIVLSIQTLFWNDRVHHFDQLFDWWWMQTLSVFSDPPPTVFKGFHREKLKLSHPDDQPSLLSRWVSVHGLNHHEMRLLAEKVSDQPETLDTEDKLVEFSLPSWQVITLSQLFNQLMNNKSRWASFLGRSAVY